MPFALPIGSCVPHRKRRRDPWSCFAALILTALCQPSPACISWLLTRLCRIFSISWRRSSTVPGLILELMLADLPVSLPAAVRSLGHHYRPEVPAGKPQICRAVPSQILLRQMAGTVFLLALRSSSNALYDAMESRCYDGDHPGAVTPSPQGKAWRSGADLLL